MIQTAKAQAPQTLLPLPPPTRAALVFDHGDSAIAVSPSLTNSYGSDPLAYLTRPSGSILPGTSYLQIGVLSGGAEAVDCLSRREVATLAAAMVRWLATGEFRE